MLEGLHVTAENQDPHFQVKRRAPSLADISEIITATSLKSLSALFPSVQWFGFL